RPEEPPVVGRRRVALAGRTGCATLVSVSGPFARSSDDPGNVRRPAHRRPALGGGRRLFPPLDRFGRGSREGTPVVPGRRGVGGPQPGGGLLSRSGENQVHVCPRPFGGI